MKHLLSLMILLITFSVAGGADIKLNDYVFVDDRGTLIIQDVTGNIQHFGESWAKLTIQGIKSIADVKSKKLMLENGKLELVGKMKLKGAQSEFDFQETIQITTDNAFSFKAKLTSEKPVVTKNISYVFSLPLDVFAGRELVVDDHKTKLPVEFNKRSIFNSKKPVKSIVIPLEDKKIELKAKKGARVYIQDERAYNTNLINIKIMFSPSEGDIKQTEVGFEVIVSSL